MLIGLLLLPVFAQLSIVEKSQLTKVNVYGRLIYNTDNCFQNCYADFEVTNPLDKPIKFNPDAEFKYGNIKSHLWQIHYAGEVRDFGTWETYIEEEDKWQSDIVCKEVVTVNGTKAQECTNKGSYIKVNVTKYRKVSDILIIQPHTTEVLRLNGRKDILGRNNVEWIPEITLDDDVSIKNTDWAWWNSNWGLRQCSNVTNPNAINMINEPKIHNFTGLTISSGDGFDEIRMSICDTENEWPCTAETEITSQVENTDNSTWAETTFQSNVTASSYRVLCIYYDNSGASDPGYTDEVVLGSWLGNTTFRTGAMMGHFKNNAGVLVNLTDMSTGFSYVKNSGNIGVIYTNNWNFAYGENDDTCTTLIDGPIHARIRCTSGEASTVNNTFDIYANKGWVEFLQQSSATWMLQDANTAVWNASNSNITTKNGGTFKFQTYSLGLQYPAEIQGGIFASTKSTTNIGGYLFDGTTMVSVGTSVTTQYGDGGIQPITVYIGRNNTGFPLTAAGINGHFRYGSFRNGTVFAWNDVTSTAILNDEYIRFNNPLTISVGAEESAPITNCSPTLDANWVISDTQVCSGTSVTTGTGDIIVASGGLLFIDSDATVTANQLIPARTGLYMIQEGGGTGPRLIVQKG